MCLFDSRSNDENDNLLSSGVAVLLKCHISLLLAGYIRSVY